KKSLSDDEKTVLASVQARQKDRDKADAAKKQEFTLAALNAYKDTPERKANGRRLFSERGCLACHTHNSTAQEDTANKIPALPSDAHFGPTLTQLVGKLGADGEKDDAHKRMWLMQWVLEPPFHHPRTFMPVTHLKVEEAADVAVWLLSQP